MNRLCRPLVLATIATSTRAPVNAFSLAKSSNTFGTNTIASRTKPVRMIGSIMDFLGGKDAKLIDPSKALPGRSKKMPNIDTLRHYVLGNKIEAVPSGHQVSDRPLQSAPRQIQKNAQHR